MLRSLTVLVVISSLFFGSAQAAGVRTLQEVFADYSYTLQVDGNRDLADQNLRSDLQALVQSGTSAGEIVNFSIAQIRDQQTAAQLRQLYSLVDANQLSADQALIEVRSMLEQSQQHGASWSGGVADVALIGGLLALVIVIAVTAGPGLCADQAYYDSHSAACDGGTSSTDWIDRT